MPLSPEWAKLPKRHCDNCGTLYKQVRPRREGEHGFCKDNCRKSFHKHQGAYSKLKGDMEKMVQKEFASIHAEIQELRAHITSEPPMSRRIATAISQSLSPSPAAQRANR